MDGCGRGRGRDAGAGEQIEVGGILKEMSFLSRAAELPEKALKAAAREFKRLKKMSPQVRLFRSKSLEQIVIRLF